jgi:hypothetical protein
MPVCAAVCSPYSVCDCCGDACFVDSGLVTCGPVTNMRVSTYKMIKLMQHTIPAHLFSFLRYRCLKYQHSFWYFFHLEKILYIQNGLGSAHPALKHIIINILFYHSGRPAIF